MSNKMFYSIVVAIMAGFMLCGTFALGKAEQKSFDTHFSYERVDPRN